MVAGIILLLVLPLIMGGVVYFLLRWTTVAALLSIATTVLLGLAVTTLPLDRPVRLWGGPPIALGETVTIFGRELVLEEADRMAMAFMFFTAAGIFFLAWRAAPRSPLFPMGLGLLSLFTGALLIRPLIYAALLLEIAAALAVFALQEEGAPPTRGGLRYLTFTTLALPGLLVIHWLLARYALTPDETKWLGAAATLLAFSFALLLGAVPFHTWVTALARDSAPVAGVFVLTVGNAAVWFLLLDFLETAPWLSGHSHFGPLVLSVGLVTVAVGGALASAQRRFGSLLGYATLADNGAALVALGTHTHLGIALIFLLLLVRPFGLGLMAIGLSGLRARSGGGDRFENLRGQGWRSPWSTAALLFGGLSVAGMPVSAGFIGRWALCRSLLPSSPAAALFLLLAGVGVLSSLWRGMAALVARPRSPENRSVVVNIPPESHLTAAVIAAAIVAGVVVGLFPQVLAPVTLRMAAGYTFFAP